jgi:hypothetical protein
MDIPEFVPTLAELIKANEDWGSQCQWHNQKKGSQNVERCGNVVRGCDVRERDDLIDRLRVLIRSATEPATLVPVTPDSIPKIRETLEKVSMWLLCKEKHRKYSDKVLLKWSNELNMVEEATDQPTTDQPTIDQPAIDQPAMYDIREALNIDNGEKLLCHAKKEDGTRCTQPISAKNCGCANNIIATLAKARDSSSTTRDHISALAQLLICQYRYHRDQVPEKSEEWFRKIQELFPPADDVPKQPSTPPFKRTTIVESETPRSTASSIFTRAGSIATSTPPTSPPSQRQYNTRSPISESPLRSRSTNTTTTTVNDDPQPVGHSRVTRSTTHILPPKDTLLKFKPFPPKGIKAVVAEIYERIKRPIIPREKDTGYVYGFQRDGDKLIKFGFTCKMGPKARIRKWNTRCHQEVKVVLQEYLPHAAKVESLVGAILYRQRRRENLVGGLCNGGKGCPTVHEEWFEVTLECLRDVVKLCSRWIRTWPYENGILKPRWVEYINKLYEAQSNDPLEDWHIAKFAEGSTVEEVVPSKVKEEKGIVITHTEIKTELDDTVLANVPDLRQELITSSRKYVQRMKKLKDENREEEHPTKYSVDFSLHLDDVFAQQPSRSPHRNRKNSTKHLNALDDTFKAKIETADDKVTVVLNAKVKTDTIITPAEIKTEPDDDIAELGRRYRQRIKMESEDDVADVAELGRRYRQRL